MKTIIEETVTFEAASSGFITPENRAVRQYKIHVGKSLNKFLSDLLEGQKGCELPIHSSHFRVDIIDGDKAFQFKLNSECWENLNDNCPAYILISTFDRGNTFFDACLVNSANIYPIDLLNYTASERKVREYKGVELRSRVKKLLLEYNDLKETPFYKVLEKELLNHI